MQTIVHSLFYSIFTSYFEPKVALQKLIRPALWLSIGLHLALLWAVSDLFPNSKLISKAEVVEIKLADKKPEPLPPKDLVIQTQNQTDSLKKEPAYMDAPPAPSPEEWAFASKYTLKNSKGYRHSFGKQIRSMMGRAIEGPDQGHVRFRIEIAPSGQVVKVETLWKTSDLAETLARKAIASMPPSPPTPTGKSLIFEKTISFTPFATDDTPIYRDDCLPDPPSFNNPFAWDGKSVQEIKATKSPKKMSPEELAECLKQLPQDSIEGVAAHQQRQFEEWSSSKLKTQKQ